MAVNIYGPVNHQIISDMKTELRLQGHYLTGALEASMVDREEKENGGYTLTASALQYLEDLETGIPSYLISIDAKSVAGMTRYVELRMGYSGKKALKVALLILKKQQKEGMPTKGSYQFTKTGFRTEAIKDAFTQHEVRYFDMIDKVTFEELDKEFSQIKSGTI